jgi:hypothetical protein
LRNFHGSHLKVCLALCAQQARAGRNQPFSFSIPKIINATSLSERAVGMALGALEKNGLIDRQKNPGPTGNRYRILWEEPAAENKKHAKMASGTKRRPSAGSRRPKNPPQNPRPRAHKAKLVVRAPNLLEGLVPDEAEQPAIAAAETTQRPSGPQRPKKSLPDLDSK